VKHASEERRSEKPEKRGQKKSSDFLTGEVCSIASGGIDASAEVCRLKTPWSIETIFCTIKNIRDNLQRAKIHGNRPRDAEKGKKRFLR
jgi:hypothetical protein